MRRVVRRGVALGLVSVGAATAAVGGPVAPVGAEPARSEATATPARAAPNGDVTLASVDPCAVDGTEADSDVELAYAYGPDGWRRRGDAPLAADFAALAPDGGWEVTLEAPEEFGAYDVVALCVTQGDDVPFVVHGYYDLAFRVSRRPVPAPPAGGALWPFA